MGGYLSLPDAWAAHPELAAAWVERAFAQRVDPALPRPRGSEEALTMPGAVGVRRPDRAGSARRLNSADSMFFVTTSSVRCSSSVGLNSTTSVPA